MSTVTPIQTLPVRGLSLLSDVIVAGDDLATVARSARTLAQASGQRVIVYEPTSFGIFDEEPFEACVEPLFRREQAGRVICEVFPSGNVFTQEVN